MNEQFLRRCCVIGSFIGLFVLFLVHIYAPIPERNLFMPQNKIEKEVIIQDKVVYNDKETYTVLVPMTAYASKEFAMENGQKVSLRATTGKFNENYVLFIDDMREIPSEKKEHIE